MTEIHVIFRKLQSPHCWGLLLQSTIGWLEYGKKVENTFSSNHIFTLVSYLLSESRDR